MTVTLFGASGRTGSLLLEICLARAWPVRAFVRDAARLAPRAGLSVVAGDARDDAALRPAIDAAGAVLCCLGMHDISVPATDFSDSVKAIVRTMQASGVRRIVAIGSAGVLDHPEGGLRHQHGGAAMFHHVNAEHQRNLETLRASGLDWTLMCPLMLVDDIPAGHARRAFDALPAGAEQTGYADLARTMADLVAESASFGHRVGIVSDR